MKQKIFHVAAAAAMVCAFASCQQFFTTSLGTPLARPASALVPAVTASNAADLAAEVANDPDASLVVLTGLEDVIAAASAADQPALVALALDVASNASGVGGALLESSGDIATILTSGNLGDSAVQSDLFAAIDSAIQGLDNLGDSATTLTAILGGTSASMADIKASATADELAMAAIVLLASNAQTDGVSDYVSYLGTGPTLTASEQLAMDLATAAAEKYDESGGTGPLASVLEALNLYTP